MANVVGVTPILEETSFFAASSGPEHPAPDHLNVVDIPGLDQPDIDVEYASPVPDDWVFGSCQTIPGQILTTEFGSGQAGASDFRLLGDRVDVQIDRDLVGSRVVDPRSGDEIGIAVVTPGAELDLVLSLLQADIFADLNRVVLPAPKWQYGPGSLARPLPGFQLSAAPEQDEPVSVNVIDIFGAPTTSPIGQHGEFVAGIIERLGAQPLRQNVDIYANQRSDTALVAWAIHSGINNLSMGVPECLVELDGDLIDLPPIVLSVAVAGKDATLVAAAGNTIDLIANDPPTCATQWYPAAFAEEKTYASFLEPWIGDLDIRIVSVAATAHKEDQRYRGATFSYCGSQSKWLPGAGIISDYDGGAAAWDGTSFAAPQHAALLALDAPRP